MTKQTAHIQSLIVNHHYDERLSAGTEFRMYIVLFIIRPIMKTVDHTFLHKLPCSYCQTNFCVFRFRERACLVAENVVLPPESLSWV